MHCLAIFALSACDKQQSRDIEKLLNHVVLRIEIDCSPGIKTNRIVDTVRLSLCRPEIHREIGRNNLGRTKVQIKIGGLRSVGWRSATTDIVKRRCEYES